MTWSEKLLDNIVGKGENAGNQHFLLFPQCFLHFPKQNSFFFSLTFVLLSANALNFDWSKILFCTKGFRFTLMYFNFCIFPGWLQSRLIIWYRGIWDGRLRPTKSSRQSLSTDSKPLVI